jgi:predicted RNase H-like nuclease (RuvC/YqgF family)
MAAGFPDYPKAQWHRTVRPSDIVRFVNPAGRPATAMADRQSQPQLDKRWNEWTARIAEINQDWAAA